VPINETEYTNRSRTRTHVHNDERVGRVGRTDYWSRTSHEPAVAAAAAAARISCSAIVTIVCRILPEPEAVAARKNAAACARCGRARTCVCVCIYMYVREGVYVGDVADGRIGGLLPRRRRDAFFSAVVSSPPFLGVRAIVLRLTLTIHTHAHAHTRATGFRTDFHDVRTRPAVPRVSLRKQIYDIL